MRNASSFVTISATILLVFAAVSCARVEIKKLPPQNLSDYKFMSQQNGLKISVDPYKEEARLKEYFGCDLTLRGVLPIAVIIENQNGNGGYILNLDKMALVMRKADLQGSDYAENQDGAKPVILQGGPSSGSVDALNALTMGSILFFPLLLPASILSSSIHGQMEDETVIRNSIEEKRLVVKTLYPGEKQHGFLYFKINNKQDLARIQGVNLSLKHLRSEQTMTLNIEMIGK